MKTFIKILLIGALLLSSCEDFVTGINEADVTSSTDADLRLIVVAAEVNYMGFHEGHVARLSGMWSGYFRGADRQYVGYNNYHVTNSDFDVAWENLYIYTLKQLRIARQKATEQNNLSTKGMCQVMEASLMGTATALWGDVPYLEAVDVQKYPNPAYDSQEIIIGNLILLLDDAIINLSSGVGIRIGDFLSPDIGDNSQWLKVAHSVKSRLLLYKKDYSNALAEAEEGIQNPEDDLMALHGTTIGTDLNLYFDFLEVSRQGTMDANNTHLGEVLDPTSPNTRNHSKTDESSRLAYYYMGGSVEDYLPNTTPTGFFFMDSPFPLHSAYEIKLIAAECMVRLGDNPGAILKLNEHRANLRQIYPNGVYEDFVLNDFNPGEIENISTSKSRDEALLYEILEEKWVSLYGQIEGFNDIRRTHNALGIPANFGTEIPQRFLYSQNEINGNLSTPNPQPGLNDRVALFGH